MSVGGNLVEPNFGIKKNHLQQGKWGKEGSLIFFILFFLDFFFLSMGGLKVLVYFGDLLEGRWRAIN